jgi:hypothetical protein
MEGWTEAIAKEFPSEWNSEFSTFEPTTTIGTGRVLTIMAVHLCNVEPGGVKTNYASTSFKMMER